MISALRKVFEDLKQSSVNPYAYLCEIQKTKSDHLVSTSTPKGNSSENVKRGKFMEQSEKPSAVEQLKQINGSVHCLGNFLQAWTKSFVILTNVKKKNKFTFTDNYLESLKIKKVELRQAKLLYTFKNFRLKHILLRHASFIGTATVQMIMHYLIGQTGFQERTRNCATVPFGSNFLRVQS